ncbi:MAG TPA: NAD(P)H-dependent glycerol-3-phosphate dehydrogenase [Acidimicrobiia bacterium]|nr:NAD(P)H-dependent glycerol-3-phosphate dehydrogenase [Acidimicrobiia bacterium]
MRVTVLGAGSWGTTVASLTAGRHTTMLWARDPKVAAEVNDRHTNAAYLPGLALPTELRATSDLADAVGSAQVLIVGVPTHGFRSVLEQVQPHIHPWIPVVSLSKGFEQGSLLRMTELIKEVLPGHPAAALTGPNIAREILAGQAAASVIATEDLEVAGALQQLLQRGMFRLYTNHDVIGCEVGGALKNVIAIAAGIAQGIGVGDNTRAAVITRGLAELSRLGVAMGGEPATFAGLTGMGDLIATCVSPHSRNRKLGEQLGLGRKLDDILAESTMVAEGVKTATTVMTLSKQYDVAMPICTEIYGVVQGDKTGLDAYRGLTRPGHESEPG